MEKQKEIVQKLNAVQEYPGSRTSTSSAYYGAGKKGLLEQKMKLQELFDSVLYRSMTGELDMVK
jgi:hypothetical protein